MKLYLISYTPGYSADFLASLIHEDRKFYPIENVERKTDNRFLFPNFTKTFHSKMTNDISNFLLQKDYEYLKKRYNKNLCINTHMFANIHGPYERKVKIFSSSDVVRNISYALWWHKSHIANELPNKERLKKLMTDPSVPEKLKTNYCKWKYLAWLKLNDENCTLENYVNKMYKFSSGAGSTRADFEGFDNIDIDKTIYSKTVDVNSINKIFDVEIDKFKLEKYRDKNYTVLEDMKVDPQSKQFFKQLYKYVKNNIESNEINLYNQYTHKQQSKEVNIV